MTSWVGPVLHARGASGDGTRLAAVVVTPADEKPPDLRPEDGRAIAADALWTAHGRTVWRSEFALPVRPGGARYALGERTFRVATGISGDLRVAYVSCNGDEDEDPGDPRQGRNAMWRRLAAAHAERPFALLLHGGDQLYADPVWRCHPALAGSRQQLRRAPFTDAMAEAVDRFYLEHYLALFAQPDVAPLLAEVPSLMMWDDHDIFDGWGSHPDPLHYCPVYEGIYRAARRHFALFQLGARPDALPATALDPAARTLAFSCRIGPLAVIAPDLRSERTQRRIMGEHGWRALEHALDANRDAEHVTVMSSVPALGPRLSLVERLMVLIPGAQKYQDDLRDQWQSYAHRAEWRRFLGLLVRHAQARGGGISIVSGEIHLASRGELGCDGLTIHQLIASGIAHSPPPGLYAHALGLLARLGEDVLPDCRQSLHPLPGRRRIFTTERNWLTIERRHGAWQALWTTEHGGPTPPLPLGRRSKSRPGTGDADEAGS